MKNNSSVIHLPNQPPIAVGMEMFYFIFNLDGTMADNAHRLHHITKEQPDWKAYFDDCPLDLPMAASVQYNIIVQQSKMMIDCLAENPGVSVPMVDIITSRPELYRGQTMRWLRESGFLPPHQLHMRVNGDLRPAHEVKLEMIMREYRGKDVHAVFETSDYVIGLLRGQGFPCFQVAPDGDF